MRIKQDGVGVVGLPKKFLTDFLVSSDEICLKVYLAGLNFVNRDTTFDEIAKFLNVSEEKVKDAFKYWEEKKMIEVNNEDIKYLFDGEMASFLAFTLPKYTPDEIAAHIENDENIKMVLAKAQKILGKLISSSDISTIVGFYDWLKLPSEVILMLIEYCVLNGKKSMRYIEKTALDWSDKEINTIEKAEEHIKSIEEKKEFLYKMKTLLGIYGREFTAKEKNFLTDWANNLGFSPEMIKEAYDMAIDHTGKVSFSYANKILKSWNERGIDNLEAARKEAEAGEKIKTKPAPKNNRFNNFKQKEYDYSELEQKELQKILDKVKNNL